MVKNGGGMKSMTGFASQGGGLADERPPRGWLWEMRSVNGRGRDLRLRLPETMAGLEAVVRPALEARIARGSVTLTLRLDDAGAAMPALDPAALADALDALARIDAQAAARGLACAPLDTVALLSQRGISAARGPDAAADGRQQALQKALAQDLPALLDAFDAMRRSEGAALAAVLAAQVDRVAELVAAARGVLDDRSAAIAAAHRAALARVADAVPVEETRIAQELAQMAVRLDVAEELDRLEAHCAAARALLAEDAPVGRRLDFLCQEFNREANTLCSKAQYLELTRIGLDLKAVIDQMREQIQNVE